MDGVSSLLGTPKVVKKELENKRLNDVVQSLTDENKSLRQNIETIKINATNEINKHKEQFKQREDELQTENSKLKNTLVKIFDFFPHVKELLSMESFLRKVGFGTDIIRRLFNREEVGFRGEIHSHKYDRKYSTDHSVAKVEPDPTPDRPHKFRLNIDNLEVYTWFRQKQQEFLQSIGINIKDPKNNRGVKM